MKYMGSKSRHAKYILPIILKDRYAGQYYVEPMVGGANMIDKVSGNRIAADCNYYLIEMWKKVSQGWMPPASISEEDYSLINKNKESYPAELVGYVGFALSYAGKFFGGWCRDSAKKRDYCREAHANATAQFPKLKDVLFICSDYKDLIVPDRSIVYFDPPYSGATKYGINFDHNEFWTHVRQMRNNGHSVFVSEYNAPDDFLCVWSREISSSLTRDTGSLRATERLFTLI